METDALISSKRCAIKLRRREKHSVITISFFTSVVYLCHPPQQPTVSQNRKKNTNKIAILSFSVPRARKWAKWASERASERSGGREQSEQSGAGERVSGASERANGRASGPVLTSRFLFVPDQSAVGLTSYILLYWLTWRATYSEGQINQITQLSLTDLCIQTAWLIFNCLYHSYRLGQGFHSFL